MICIKQRFYLLVLLAAMKLTLQIDGFSGIPPLKRQYPYFQNGAN